MEIIGEVTEKARALLEIEASKDRNIYIGKTNLIHMQSRHPQDFEKYGGEIRNILANPDYLRLSPNDGSIEYVKEFLRDGEYIKVAVRLSAGDRYFARTLYVLNRGRVNRLIKNGDLKAYTP